jgi:hypothetical protein
MLPKNQPERPRCDEGATGSCGLPDGAMYSGDFVSLMTGTVAFEGPSGTVKTGK